MQKVQLQFDDLTVKQKKQVKELQDQLTDVIERKGPGPQGKMNDLVKSVAGLQDKIGDQSTSQDYGLHFASFLDKGEDATAWLREFENCAEFKGYDSKRKVQVLKVLLKNGAATWFDRFLNENVKGELSQDRIMETFKKKFIERFDKGNTWLEEHLVMFLTQKPHETVQQYYSKLTERAAKLNKSSTELLPMFIRGLASPVKTYVLARQPDDIQTAFSLAKTAESLKAITDLTDNELQPLGMPGEITTGSRPVVVRDTSEDNLALKQELKKLQQMVSKLSMNSQQRRPLDGAAVIRCHYCNAAGHRQVECRKRARDLSNRSPMARWTRPGYVTVHSHRPLAMQGRRPQPAQPRVNQNWSRPNQQPRDVANHSEN